MGNIVQTGIRMDAELLERLKLEAKRQGQSLNTFMARVLAASVTPVLPKLKREDFEGELRAEKFAILDEVPQELIDSDPKIARLMSV